MYAQNFFHQEKPLRLSVTTRRYPELSIRRYLTASRKNLGIYQEEAGRTRR